MRKLLLLILLFVSVSKAQDSLKQVLSVDSTFADQVIETLQDSVKKKTFDVDDVVTSTASDSIKFDLVKKQMFVFGKGELKYKQTTLTGGKINVDFKNNSLHAEGIFEHSDSTGKKELSQTPMLSEGGENYEGTSLDYNFKTQKGFISAAKNVKETQRYEGSAVKKVSKNTFFIKDGVYTTCKSDTPHTHFTAAQMKVIQKNKIFAKWIFMYIAGVPLPIPIPFAVFPNEKGRRSGLIAPTYGSIANRGQYFKDFGYFFAINDYMDLRLTGDYYMRGGWASRARFRYTKRYNFSGNLGAGYSKIIIGEDGDPDKSTSVDWYLRLAHNQTFTPSLKLNANLNFQTGSYFSNNSIKRNELLTQDITSNATLSKRWDESGNSLTINYNRRQNIKSGNIYEILPNISFNKSQFYPFKTSASARDESWYEKIGLGYSGNFKNKREQIDGNLKIRAGIQHNISINASPKIGYFNISPRISYREKWYNKKTKQYTVITNNISSLQNNFNSTNSVNVTDSVVSKDVRDINILRTFDLGVSASTKLYGMMQPRILGIEAFRHTVTPSISYNYNPDFSKKKWGYYETIKRADGTYEYYDPYSNEIFGGVGSGESQSVSFSVGNIFEMKTMKDPTDTTSKAKKITLLNFDLSTGYNFAADSLKFSDLRLSYRTQIGNILNFSGSSIYSFYDYQNNRKVNKYLVNNGKGLFRLTSLNLSISASISGEKLAGEDRKGKKPEDEEEFDTFRQQENERSYREEETDFSIPWNLSLSYNYNFSKPGLVSTVNSNLGINLGFNLAKNWKFGLRGNYDFQDKEFAAPQVTVYRDLECWEMNFSWNPIGNFTGFRFEIRMKAPELRDVKVTRRRGLYSGR